MSTLTWKETFYKIDKVSYDTTRVCLITSYICLSLWFLLSLVWAAILSSRLHKDWKVFKNQNNNKHFMSGKEWGRLEKNYRSKRNNKLLMIFLCFVEAIASLSIIIALGYGMSNSQIFHQLGVYVIQPFDYLEKEIWLEYRLVVTLVCCVIITMFSMVSLITTCLIQHYAYYSSNHKHPIRHGILRLFLKIIVISLLGSVVQLVILQRLVGYSLLFYEAIRNIVLMRKLVRLLYQRYFDARFHEYHHSSIVAYYKQSYFELRIASPLYFTSLFFHMISILIQNFYPIILTMLTNPKWLQHVYNIPIERDHFLSVI